VAIVDDLVPASEGDPAISTYRQPRRETTKPPSTESTGASV